MCLPGLAVSSGFDSKEIHNNNNNNNNKQPNSAIIKLLIQSNLPYETPENVKPKWSLLRPGGGISLLWFVGLY